MVHRMHRRNLRNLFDSCRKEPELPGAGLRDEPRLDGRPAGSAALGTWLPPPDRATPVLSTKRFDFRHKTQRRCARALQGTPRWNSRILKIGDFPQPFAHNPAKSSDEVKAYRVRRGLLRLAEIEEVGGRSASPAREPSPPSLFSGVVGQIQSRLASLLGSVPHGGFATCKWKRWCAAAGLFGCCHYRSPLVDGPFRNPFRGWFSAASTQNSAMKAPV